LGDLVLLTPALTALKTWRPDLQLCVLAEPKFAGVLEGNPQISEILLHRGFSSTVTTIRKRHFSVVFNQHGGPTSALLTAASGIPMRVCWERRQFGFFYNVHVPSPAAFYGRDDVHTVEQRLTQFYAAGLPRGPIPPARIYPSAESRASVARLLAANGISAAEGYAVVRPGATHPAKRWAMENFATIAHWLRAERGIPTVINLGPDEREMVSPLRELCGAQIPVLDALNLSELMVLLAGASLYVGNDSGPTHIAAAARCPVAVIFGASNPVHWRPWMTEYRLLRSEQPATPGLPSVGLGDVQAACDELLNATGMIRRGANATSVQQ
jgi:ADP-heptose:LPS heptosyltransferase